MLRISNKKGQFIGWFLFIVLILFIAVPLIMEGITNQLGSSDLLARAEVNCYSIIPTKAISGVLCRPVFVDYGKGTNQSLPLLFVLITFVLTAVLIYALIEDVPPFRNQIQNHRRGPAAVFTILIAAMVSFFTSTPKYVTILLTLSGSVIVYTVIAVFLVFVFWRIGLHSHREGRNYLREHYTGLANDRRAIRQERLANREISRDIRRSRELEKELKELRQNDAQERKPLEQLEKVLRSIQGALNRLNSITDPNERQHALHTFRENAHELQNLVQRIQREFRDETKINQHITSIENTINNTLRIAQKNIRSADKNVITAINAAAKNGLVDNLREKSLRGQLAELRADHNKIIAEIDGRIHELEVLRDRLQSMLNNQNHDIAPLLNEVRRIINTIGSGNLPDSQQILDAIQHINNLKAVIEDNERIINQAQKVDEELRDLLERAERAVNQLNSLATQVPP